MTWLEPARDGCGPEPSPIDIRRRETMTLIRKRGGMAMLSLVALAAAAGCARRDDDDLARVEDTTAMAEPDDLTMVRFVHAAPNAPDLNVSTGDQGSMFSQVSFKDVTPYREIEENRPEFKAMPANQPAAEPLAKNAEMVLDGKYYTVVAVPSDDGKGVELETLRDDGDKGDATKARVRFVHAAPRAGDIDVIVNNDTEPFFDDIAFGGDPNYKEVMPGTALIQVRAGKANTVLLRMSEMQFAAGESVTIVLTHPSASSDKIEAIRITDQDRAVPPTDSVTPRRDSAAPPSR
jgi:hypothetical protein